MRRRFSEEFHAFMREFIPGHTSDEIRAAVSERFGIDMTPEHVKYYKNNHKIRSGTQRGLPKGTPTEQFPARVAAYIGEHAEGVGPAEMWKRLNGEFGTDYTREQIKAYYANHGISSGLDGRFKPGHKPPNKGKKGMSVHPNFAATQFKKGHQPTNKYPVGTVRERGDGYLWRKIGEGANEWRHEHLVRWEAEHGPVPPGHMVVFADGDRKNLTPENLRLISKAANGIRNRKGLRSENAELNKAGILVAEIEAAALKRRKKAE